jgi:hypothetical protein
LPTNQKEYNRDYLRNYRKTHPEYAKKANEQSKLRARKRRATNPEGEKQKANLRHEKLRQKLLLIIGSRCIICNSTENIIFHEIYGKEHDTGNLWTTLKRPQDFLPLCFPHHKLIHFLTTIQSDKELERAVILSANIDKKC